MAGKKYQVFVSSTYTDLRVERSAVIYKILEGPFFPVGMELFPAGGDGVWQRLERQLQVTDFYVVVVGTRYGSLRDDGTSWTEAEYRRAVELDIPILAFAKREVGADPRKGEVAQAKFVLFRDELRKRWIREWSTPEELANLVLQSLQEEARVKTRPGWSRTGTAVAQDHEDPAVAALDLSGNLEVRFGFKVYRREHRGWGGGTSGEVKGQSLQLAFSDVAADIRKSMPSPKTTFELESRIENYILRHSPDAVAALRGQGWESVYVELDWDSRDEVVALLMDRRIIESSASDERGQPLWCLTELARSQVPV